MAGSRGDFLLFGFVGNYVGAVRGNRLLVLLLGVKISLVGVLKISSRAFVTGQVIFLSVVLGACTMRMSSKVPALSRYLL